MKLGVLLPLLPIVLVGCGSRITGSVEPPGATLAVAAEGEVWLVKGDGERLLAHAFAGEPQGVELAARGGRIAVAANAYDMATGQSTSELAVLDAEGSLVFADAPAVGWSGSLHLGDDGALAARVGDFDMRVVRPDGSSELVADMTPEAAPLPDGTVPVRLEPSVYALQYGFHAPAVGVVPIGDGVTPSVFFGGGAFHYLAYDEGGAGVLVREAPGEVTSVPYTAVDSGHVKAVSRGGDVLVQHWSEETFWPNDVLIRAGSAIAEPVGLPQDRTPFGYAVYFGVEFLGDGTIGIPARDAPTGGFYARTTDGAWNLVGGTFREIWSMIAVARDGAFVVSGSEEAGYFPMDTWEPAPADHVGEVSVAVKGTLAHTLPEGARGFALSAGGARLAYLVGGEVWALDLADGSDPILLGDFGETATFAWVD